LIHSKVGFATALPIRGSCALTQIFDDVIV